MEWVAVLFAWLFSFQSAPAIDNSVSMELNNSVTEEVVTEDGIDDWSNESTDLTDDRPWYSDLRIDRRIVAMAAESPSGRTRKFPIASAQTGSVWSVRAMDVAPIWRRNDTNPQVWVFLDHSKDKTVQDRSGKRLYAIDCVRRTTKTLSIIGYDARGKVTFNHSASYAASQPIVPETVMEAVAEFICPFD